MNRRSRKFKSIKTELVKKAREAMLAAVEIFNNPIITFKAESFITLAIIGWTYLLHAYYREHCVEYRYFELQGKRKKFGKTKGGAYKYWELEKCISVKENPIDNEAATNLRFLIGVRHEIEHCMTNRIDQYISAKLQACAINFDFYIQKFFGSKYGISDMASLNIQFSPVNIKQFESMKDDEKITSNIRNFVFDFENTLSDDIMRSSRYAYRVKIEIINANHRGGADKTCQFSRTSKGDLADTVIVTQERNKYLPKKIVSMMKEKGYKKFNIHYHTELWKRKDAKNPDYGYGVLVVKQWYWYESWLREVESYCRGNKDSFM